MYRQEVTIEIEGKSYTGNYSVDGNLITVDCSYGTKTAKIIARNEIGTAKMLLRELLTNRQ